MRQNLIKGVMNNRQQKLFAFIFSVCFVFLISINTMAQQENKPTTQPQATIQPTPTTPQANPKDVESMDAILAAVYDVISGPAGKKRDWDRFRSLFQPGARLIPVAKLKEGDFTTRVLTVEDYITRANPFMEKEGFFEKEIARKVETFGHITHVFSAYESKHKAEDEKPFARGINSIQLFYDGKRWWVMTIYWDGETPEQPIPQKYLKN